MLTFSLDVLLHRWALANSVTLWTGLTRDEATCVRDTSNCPEAIRRAGWEWVDNSQSNYENWAFERPSGGQTCVVMDVFHNSDWNDEFCTDVYKFVCKKLDLTSICVLILQRGGSSAVFFNGATIPLDLFALPVWQAGSQK